MEYSNKRLLLVERPKGMPGPEAWSWDTELIQELPDGHFLIEHHFVSIDPAMRGWMNAMRSYIPPVDLGAVMRAGTVGKVLESKHPGFSEGDIVVGMGGVQEYAISSGKGWVSTRLPESMMPKALGVLGMTGFTAYFGLLDIGMPKEGQTVLVSAGAGAVGSIVGQVAKIKGCRVVGIAGGEEKCTFMREVLGYDEAIDYKTGQVGRAIRAACPDGIDVYFDNVGGDMLNDALANLARGARVVICGAISQYNESRPQGPANYLSLLVNRASMTGFVVFDYASRYQEAASELGRWMQEGRLHSEETIVDGLDQFYPAFQRLFSGEKRGKLMLGLKH